MKSKQHYIQKYRAQKKALTESGELWRLRYKKEANFIEELDEILDRYENGYFLNDFHRNNSTQVCLGMLTQKMHSSEEIREQIRRHREE